MIYEEERQALDASSIGGAWRAGFDRLAELALESQALDPAVREIGLALTFAGRGMTREAHRHGRRALDCGMTRPQVVEALITGLLHGGYGIFWECAWMIDEAPAAPWVGHPDAALDDPATIRAYFEGVWGGELPPWLQLTGDASPAQLAAYYQLRTDAMGEGALAKKHKEIIIMLMSCAEHYEFGIGVHARGALAAGASKAELIDAVRASVIAGGIVAWVEGFGPVDTALREAGL
jgi:alkylhydroperoxidase/carboxymuconolactone decarboxylase family protein YurZ